MQLSRTFLCDYSDASKVQLDSDKASLTSLVSQTAKPSLSISELQSPTFVQMASTKPMKARLEQRQTELTDLMVSLRESHEMAVEEARSVSCEIENCARSHRSDQQIEWLERLISATRIQCQDAQRKLDMLRGES